MSNDSFTETVSTGWFSRIGDSIKGIFLGLLMVVAAFPILFINEGCAVDVRKTLDQGSKEVIDVESSAVDPANEGKLIHLTGQASSPKEIGDKDFRVSSQSLRLEREVSMFQWKESSEEKTKKKLGGGTETTTTYTYTKDWHKGRIDSSQFEKPDGHHNPSPKVSSSSWTAPDAKLGAFTLNASLIEKIDSFQPIHIHEDNTSRQVAASNKKLHIHDGIYYYGKSPDAPEVGDLRISFRHIPSPTEVSMIAQQKGTGFEPFIGKSGASIYMLQVGNHSAQAMIEQAKNSNSTKTWIIRGVGLLVMFFGFSLIFNPLSVVADVIPIAGSIVGVGTGIVSFLLAVPLSLATIAVAWVYYRPIIGIPLLIAAAVGIFFLIQKLYRYNRSRG
ncbi:TMEM43 family protein [Verrucomicrobiaceae bacterium N1E253]|uniref:TMEM43 family protein n=1 Tax=Oceaniferula marina TaxID=2748318 RepID=A0A851GLH3_9BACT|nr:TMEM43 family protein [Oceaniferula marina]NWK55927.1 TMEM43 family protein [Oceaniferula marina]